MCVFIYKMMGALPDFSFYGLHRWLHWFHPRSLDAEYNGENLSSTSQFKSARKTRNVLVHELMFADVSAFVAESDSLEIITHFSKSALVFEPYILTLRESKLNTNPLWDLMIFEKLGSTVANKWLDAQLEIQAWFKVFVGLKKWVWLNKDVSIKTKCAVYCSIVLWTHI